MKPGDLVRLSNRAEDSVWISIGQGLSRYTRFVPSGTIALILDVDEFEVEAHVLVGDTVGYVWFSECKAANETG